jgi:hypothetical protein
MPDLSDFPVMSDKELTEFLDNVMTSPMSPVAYTSQAQKMDTTPPPSTWQEQEQQEEEKKKKPKPPKKGKDANVMIRIKKQSELEKEKRNHQKQTLQKVLKRASLRPRKKANTKENVSTTAFST